MTDYSIILADLYDHPLALVKYKIFSFLDRIIVPSATIMAAIRIHLNKSYCPRCGEYIYQYKNRKIRHYHFPVRKYTYQCKLYNRIRAHPMLSFIEWERHFPNVFRFSIHNDDVMIQRSFSILSRRIWTLEEWTYHYPHYTINDRDQRLSRIKIKDPLEIPDLRL